jgi:hypothetical protein
MTSKNTKRICASLSNKRILTTWLPLVGSWLIMSLESPAINAIIARLQDSEINLAAYGSVAFSIAIIINAPAIMLLAASTALCRDWKTYLKLQKFSLIIGIILSAIHLSIAVTPIYDFIVNVLMDVPEEIVEPGRIGLICMVPFSFGIAYRRFQQGVMIRFGHSKMVWETTLARLVVVVIVLIIGMVVKTIPGVLIGGLSQGLGVVAAAIYAGLRVRKITPEIQAVPTVDIPLTLKYFLKFYFPLALTSTLLMLWQPLISAAVSRMPDPLESLAIWSIISGVLNSLRSPGMAYREAVVALLDEPEGFRVLRKFTLIGSIILISYSILFVWTPLSEFWFSRIAYLESDLVRVAQISLAIGIPAGLLRMYLSFYEGIIMNKGRTNTIAEAVVVFLVAVILILLPGVLLGSIKGVYVASAAYLFANLVQTVWLMLRSRRLRKEFAA